MSFFDNQMYVIVFFIIIGTLFPIGIAVWISQQDTLSCNEAFGSTWSAYYNTTNGNWYNITVGTQTSYSSSIIFDGYRNDYALDNMTQYRFFGGGHTNLDIIDGEELDNRIYNITRIQVLLKAHPLLDTDITLRFGVFNKNTGAVIQTFAVIDPNTDLILDNVPHLYNYTSIYYTTDGSNKLVGFKTEGTDTFRGGSFASWATFYYKLNGIVYPPFPEPTSDMLMNEYEGGQNPNSDYDFAVKITNSSGTTEANTSYVLIPRSAFPHYGANASGCFETTILYYIIPAFAILGVGLFFFVRAKGNEGA